MSAKFFSRFVEKKTPEEKAEALSNKKKKAFGKGDTMKAISFMTSAISRNSKGVDFQYYMGIYLSKQESFGLAADYFNTAVRLNQKDIEAHIGLAECRLKSNNFTLARDSCQDAINLLDTSAGHCRGDRKKLSVRAKELRVAIDKSWTSGSVIEADGNSSSKDANPLDIK